MKIVFRTLAILVAALVVVAGVYAFSASGLAQGLRAGGPGRGDVAREGGRPPAFAAPEQPDGPPAGHREHGGFAGHGEHEGHSPGLSGLIEVGKNLAIVTGIITLIALGARLLRLDRRKSREDRSPGEVPGV